MRHEARTSMGIHSSNCLRGRDKRQKHETLGIHDDRATHRPRPKNHTRFKDGRGTDSLRISRNRGRFWFGGLRFAISLSLPSLRIWLFIKCGSTASGFLYNGLDSSEYFTLLRCTLHRAIALCSFFCIQNQRQPDNLLNAFVPAYIINCTLTMPFEEARAPRLDEPLDWTNHLFDPTGYVWVIVRKEGLN